MKVFLREVSVHTTDGLWFGQIDCKFFEAVKGLLSGI